MRRSFLRSLVAISILLLTLGAAIYYFIHHPEVGEQLRQTSPAVLGTLLGLYLAGVGALAWVTQATLRLCQTRLSTRESLLLTAYSSIVNFFGPLQSGPAFRAVYLKARHGLNLKKYAKATLVYYFFYGIISMLLLFSGVLKWWLVLAIVAAAIGCYMARHLPLVTKRVAGLDKRGWYYLALATGLQILIVTAIYYVELRTVAPGTQLWQALVYSGAANLALFVSLTPGAIGFRESFLLFSQDLHHISSSTIVAANILDRALYVTLLLVLALFIFGTHASRKLQVEPDSKD